MKALVLREYKLLVHGFDGSTGRRIPPVITGHEASGVIVEYCAAGVASLNERIPLGRPGAPNDLDGAVVYLASEESIGEVTFLF